jgi:hypothetical protein
MNDYDGKGEVSNAFINEITKLIDGKKLDLHHEYDNLPVVKYVGGTSDIKKIGCHIGQRKLMLTEIQFLSSISSDLIIYMGSAPCEHLPVIISMFPTKKFLLIDPNYHRFNHDYVYIYQNPEIVSNKTREWTMREYLAGDIKQKANTKRLFKARFYKEGVHDVVNIDNAKMTAIMERFRGENYKTLINDIKNGNEKVYIIQDYMKPLLCELIAESINSHKLIAESINSHKLPDESINSHKLIDSSINSHKLIDSSGNNDICLVSDIRTNGDDNTPSDLDYVWNDAIQLSCVKILKPQYSMLKFHPPYFNGKFDYDIPNYMMEDINYVKDRFGIDSIFNYKNGRYMYLYASHIWIQAWAPIASSEARLIISRNDIDEPYRYYDNNEWDDKFMYLKLMRGYGYHPGYYEKIKPFIPKYDSKSNEYDGCFDCALEIAILCNYIKSKLKQNKMFDVDYQFLDNEDNIKELFECKNIIENVLVRSINRCTIHGYLTKPLVGINYYSIKGDKIVEINSDGNNISIKNVNFEDIRLAKNISVFDKKIIEKMKSNKYYR